MKAAPLAVRAVKKAMYSGLNTTLETGLQIELELENEVTKDRGL